MSTVPHSISFQTLFTLWYDKLSSQDKRAVNAQFREEIREEIADLERLRRELRNQLIKKPEAEDDVIGF